MLEAARYGYLVTIEAYEKFAKIGMLAQKHFTRETLVGKWALTVGLLAAAL